MATTIESMTGIIITSPFFDVPSSLELFPVHSKVLKDSNAPQKNRVALLYGSNGSGKSTIAQGFREYSSPSINKTVSLSLSPGSQPTPNLNLSNHEKIFIFDEKYITQNIKIQKDGLETIVLFGKQVEIERRLNDLRGLILQKQQEIEAKSQLLELFFVETNFASPTYWRNIIIEKLQSPGGWAEISGIKIKRNQIKSRVTDSEIERLGRLQPHKNIALTEAEFNELFDIYDNTDSSALVLNTPITAIEVPENTFKRAQLLFTATPNPPTLTLREQNLLHSLGIDVLSTAKGFLSTKSSLICPTCLRPISEDYRSEALQQIDNILNREMQEYIDKLNAQMLPVIQSEFFQQFSALDSKLLGNIILQISKVNTLIHTYNQVIQEKISSPLSAIQFCDPSDLIAAYQKLNKLLSELESKRIAYNNIIADRGRTKNKLLTLNDEIAHYTIDADYQSLLSQRKSQKLSEDELNTLHQEKAAFEAEAARLNAQRNNIQIAVDQINKSLSYIFYSNSRLEVHLENDQMYHLKVNGKTVCPDKISCGERNALALSYFFVEIAKETEVQKIYSDEMLLVIDDPISSFDVENRVGIMSFLRYKIHQILMSCTTTKILIMTHDISVLFDLQKAMDEISSYCAGIGKHAEYCSFQLLNKSLQTFNAKSHNEYTRLMRCVFDYGCSPSTDMELTIGNITRRVLEAFSTFTFKEGAEKVSLNPHILSLIPDQTTREYFQHSMYRLVLNTESHLQESAQGAPEMSFFSHLSIEEKQRTARDVLCFMYCVNRVHVLSHIPDAKNTLNLWMKSIK